VALTEIVQRGERELRKSVAAIVHGKSNTATERARLLQLIEKWSYAPDDDVADTLNDLGSSERLTLLIETNVGLERGRIQWQEGLEKGALVAFPAFELVLSVAPPEEAVYWKNIWSNARAQLPATSATVASSGRLIALKSDPIWCAISFFKVPYPPYGVGSHAWGEDVSYEEAVDLGCMKESDDPVRQKGHLPKAPQLEFDQILQQAN